MSSRRPSYDASSKSPDWKRLLLSYPSQPFLAALHSAVKQNHLKTTASERWPALEQHVARLKPVLDSWYSPQSLWLSSNVVDAVFHIANTQKVAAHEVSVQCPAFLQSEQLLVAQKAHERAIDALLQ